MNVVVVVVVVDRLLFDFKMNVVVVAVVVGWFVFFFMLFIGLTTGSSSTHWGICESRKFAFTIVSGQTSKPNYDKRFMGQV